MLDGNICKRKEMLMGEMFAVIFSWRINKAHELAGNFSNFINNTKHTLFKNEYRCLNNTILVGYITCKSQSFKNFQLHPMVNIYFTKNKIK